MKFSFKPDEFKVEEITSEGTILELDKKFETLSGIPSGEKNEFSWFILQKNNWATQAALDSLSRKVGVSKQRFNSAGTKDRNAITTQLCSAFGVKPERLLTVHVKDISVNGAWPASEKIKMGALSGNRFTIILNPDNCGVVPNFDKFASYGKDPEILNVFGAQRFGSLRFNTHLVGYEILKGDYKAAVMNYLCFCGETENQSDTRNEEIEARRRLEKEGDFKAAMGYFPSWLKYERSMISHLANIPTDFVGALRTMPRSMQLFFIHAAQSDIFNEALKERKADGIEKKPFEGEKYCPYDANGFPDEKLEVLIDSGNKDDISMKIGREEGVISGTIVGYETEPADNYSKVVMERHGVTSAQFLLKSMPELSSKGGFRPLIVKAAGFSCDKHADEKSVLLKFSLPSGAYATSTIEQLCSP